MSLKRKLFKGLVIAILLFGFSSLSYSDIQTDKFKNIKNIILLEDDIVAGGPPSEIDIKEAAKQGIKTVIDLRKVESVGNEQEQIQNEGMKYVNIPVTADTLSQKQVDEVAAILANLDNRPVLLHCKSGNRVGALWAIYQHTYHNIEKSKAYEKGIEKGLRSDSMKTVTKQLLKIE